MRSIPLARWVAVDLSAVPELAIPADLLTRLGNHPGVVSPATAARNRKPGCREVVVPVRPVHNDVPPAVVSRDAARIVASVLACDPLDLEASIIHVGPSVHDAAYKALEALRKALEALPVNDPLRPSQTLAETAAYPLDQIERLVANHEHWRCPGSARQRTQP